MQKFIPFGEFAPDGGVFHDPATGAVGATNVAQNVVPREVTQAAVTYGPLPSPQPYSGALDARCQGAASIISTDRAVHYFAGTASKLWTLDSSSTNWQNFSQIGGYTASPDDFWSVTAMGDQVIACQINDPIQTFTIGSGATKFADLAGTPPKAKFCAVVRDFLMLGYTVGVDGTRPQRVWWSGIGDPTSWPTRGTPTAAQVQSDAQDMWGLHGALTGLAPHACRADCVVFFERAIYVMQYAGPPAIFDIAPVNGARGCIAPASIVKVESDLFYIGEDLGFYRFDGSRSYPIGLNRVDETMRQSLPPNWVGRIVGAYDPIERVIIWLCPGAGSADGVPTWGFVYSPYTDKWSQTTLGGEFILRGATFGLNLEQIGAQYPTLDDISYSLDSPAWAGKGLVTATFDTAHKLNFLQGSPLPALIETPQFMYGDGTKDSTDRRGFVKDARPAYEGTGVTATVSIGHRERVGDGFVYAAAAPVNVRGSTPVRASGRHFVAQMALSGGFDRAYGVEVNLHQQGRR